MPGSKSREQRHLVSTASLFVSEYLDADFQQEDSCCRAVQDLPSLSDLLLTCSLPPRVLVCFSAWILSPAAPRTYSQFSRALCSHTFLDCLTKTGWSSLAFFTLPRSCHQNAGSLETDLVFSMLCIKINNKKTSIREAPNNC